MFLKFKIKEYNNLYNHRYIQTLNIYINHESFE